MSSAFVSTSTPAVAPASVLFARGIIARLAIWPALRVAVDQGWGGPEGASKCTWIASVIVDAFEEEDPKPDMTYVELTLLQIMEDEFETVLEDGSAEIVAKDVVRMWEEVTSGRDVLVKGFEEQAEKIKGKKIEVEVEQGDDEGEWSDADTGEDNEEDGEGNETPMLIDSQSKPPLEPEVDEDGFTTVKGKGKNHR